MVFQQFFSLFMHLSVETVLFLYCIRTNRSQKTIFSADFDIVAVFIGPIGSILVCFAGLILVGILTGLKNCLKEVYVYLLKTLQYI